MPQVTHVPVDSDVQPLHRVRLALLDSMPACPAALVERFLALLVCAPSEIDAAAVRMLNKPYGSNALLIDTGAYGLSFAQLRPGQSTSFHSHQRRREFFCVHSGVLALTTGDRTRFLHRYECGASTPGEGHMLANGGGQSGDQSGGQRSEKTLAVLEIFSPALLDDKIRLRDRYQRALGQVSVHQ